MSIKPNYGAHEEQLESSLRQRDASLQDIACTVRVGHHRQEATKAHSEKRNRLARSSWAGTVPVIATRNIGSGEPGGLRTTADILCRSHAANSQQAKRSKADNAKPCGQEPMDMAISPHQNGGYTRKSEPPPWKHFSQNSQAEKFQFECEKAKATCHGQIGK